MKENLSLFERAKAFVRAHHRRSVWYRIISVLGVLVVFITTYMLVLPAITMVKGELICGMEEHVHNSDCYTTNYVFTCGKLESDEHTHTDDCITALSVLSCEIPEHYHEASCYAQADDTPDAAAEIAPVQAPVSGDDELVIDNTPEQETLPELPTEPEEAIEETETEPETELTDTLAWDSTTEPVRFGIRMELKDGAFAEGSALDVEYLDEAKAASYIEALKNQLASEEADRDVELTAVLPVKVSVRNASGNEVPVQDAELSIYLDNMADVTADTALFAQYETVDAAKWTPVNYVRMLGSAEDSEHLDADVEEGGVFLLANVQYVERAAQTEAPTETATEAQTEQSAEIPTETETQGPENAAAPNTQPQTEDAAGNGADQGTESESESETETEETTVRILETKAPETDETESETATEIETKETEPEYTCGLEEHTHDASCYWAPENGPSMVELVCGLTEHKHDASCIGTKETESESEIKAETETANKTETGSESVSESEKESETETEAERTSEPETAAESETTGGTETESETEAPAGDFAGGNYMGGDPGLGFEDNGELTQGKEPEEKETEKGNGTGALYTCGLAEHTHTDDCYDEEGNLVCGLEEHTHTDACVELPMADEKGENTNPYDLRNYITDVKISQKNSYYDDSPWVELHPEDGKIEISDDYNAVLEFLLSYTIPAGVIDADHPTVTYKLPEGILVKDEGMEGNVVNNAKKVVGTYKIDKEGNVTITFTDSGILNGGEIEGTLGIRGTVDRNVMGNDGSVNFEFTDKTKIDVQIGSESETKDLSVKKWGAVKKDIDNNRIEYTIEVHSASGTKGPIELHDLLDSTTAEYWKYVEDVKVTDTSTWKDLNKDKYTVTKNSEGRGIDITLSEGMKPGDTYRIVYSVKLDNDVMLYEDEIIKNSVSIKSKDNQDTDITDETTASVTVQHHDYLNKYGVYDATSGKIHWTITVNADYRDVSNWTLDDLLKKNGIEIPGSTIGNITLTEYGKNGEVVGEPQPVTFPYKFADSSTNKYVFEYDQDVVIEAGENKYTNNATVHTPDGNDYSTDDVQPQGAGDLTHKVLEKTAKAADYDSDTNTYTMNWEAKIVAPQTDLTVSEFHDVLDEKPEHTFTDAQIEALKKGLTIYNSDGTEARKLACGTDYTVNKSDDGKRFDITFTPSVNLTNGQYISFKYSSSATIPDGVSEAQYSNTAYTGTSSATASSEKYYPIVRKFDAGQGTQGSGAETSHKWNKNAEELKWRIEVHVPKNMRGKAVTIKEHLPAGVDISYLKIQIGNHDGEFVKQADGTYKAQVYEPTTNQSYDITAQVSGNDLIIVVDDATFGNPELIKLEVNVKVREDFAWQTDDQGFKTEKFTNNVEVMIDDTIVGSDIQNQTIVWDDIAQMVEKEILEVTPKPTTLKYSVKVNPNREDLLPDESMVTLEDLLRYWVSDGLSFSLVPGTVKVYEIDERGERHLLNQDDYSYTYSEEDNVVSTPCVDCILKLKVPDSKYLAVEYDYVANGPEGKGANVQNTATLKGAKYYSDNESSSVIAQESWATADTSAISIYKVDSTNNAIALPGAKFKLYVYKDGDYISVNEYETDETGLFTLSKLTYNTAYKLEEEKPPAGYMAATEPYFFYIGSEDTTTYPLHMPTDFAGERIAFGSTYYFQNTNTKTRIAVDKKWYVHNQLTNETTEAESVPLDKISFELWRRVIAVEDDTDENEDITDLRYNILKGQSGGIDDVFRGEIRAGSKVTFTLRHPEDVYWCNDYVNPLTFQTHIPDTWDYPEINADDSHCVVEGGYHIHTYVFNSIDQDILISGGAIHAGYWPEITVERPTASGSVGGTKYSFPDEKVINGEITADTGWHWVDTDLPKADNKLLADGTKVKVRYEYYVKEITELPGYITKYDNNDGIEYGSIKINNTSEISGKTGITVEKKWDDKGFDSLSDIEKHVTLQLYKKSLNSNSSDEPVGEAVTLPIKDAANPWSYNWGEDLVKEEDATYYVVEVDGSAGYDVTYNYEGKTYQVKTFEDAKKIEVKPETTLEVVNTRQTTKVTVEKQWFDVDGKPKASSDNMPEITVELFEKNATGTSTLKGTVILGKSMAGQPGYDKNGWKYTWENLPKTDKDGKDLTYYVQEETVAGFSRVTYTAGPSEENSEGTDPTEETSEPTETASESAVAGGTITVSNYEDGTDISVEKEWVGGNEGQPNVTMKLYSSITPPEPEKEPESEPESEPTDSEVVAPRFTFRVANWKNSDNTPASAPTESAWIWTQVIEYDGNINNIPKDSEGNWIPTAQKTLPADGAWSYTFTSPELGLIKPGETKYYILQCGSGGAITGLGGANGDGIIQQNITVTADNPEREIPIDAYVRAPGTQTDKSEYIDIPVNVNWLVDVSGIKPLYGWISIYKYDGDQGSITWANPTSTVEFSSETTPSWSSTISHLEIKDSNGNPCYYCVQVGINDVKEQNIYFDIDGLNQNKHDIYFDGNKAPTSITVTAKKKQTEVTNPNPDTEINPGETTAKTVRVLVDDPQINYFENNVIISQSGILSDTVNVKIVYNSNDLRGNFDNVRLETTDVGVTISKPGISDSKSEYNNGVRIVEFRVSGIKADCDLIYKNSGTFPAGGRGAQLGSELIAHAIEELSPSGTDSSANTIRTFSSGTATISSSPITRIYNPIVSGCKRPDDAQEVVGASVVLGSSYSANASTETGHYGIDGWHYTWENLPKTDEAGNTLYYYVVEDSLGEGYETEYSYEYIDETDPSKGIKLVKVRNTPPPAPETMSVTVYKEWVDQNDKPKAAGLDHIDVTLYNSGNEVKGTAKLEGSTGWTYTWDDLPIDTYHVEEDLGENEKYYDVSYSVDGDVITITNQSTSVSVDKKWIDKAGQEMSGVSDKTIMLQLYRINKDGAGETFGDSVTLNGGESPTAWHYEWPNLPLDEYYVVETPIEGFMALYTNSEESLEDTDRNLTAPENAKVKSGTITITNYEDTEIEVEKKWNDSGKSSHEGITVNLYSSTTPPNKDIVAKNKEKENIASTMKLSLGVTDWVDGDKDEVEPTTDGRIWMTVQACDSTGEPLLDENGEAVVYANSLTASNNWHQTTQELPATVINENGETETKYYLLRFGSENADTQNGIQKLSVLNGPDETNGIVVAGNASIDGKLSYNLQATVAGTDTLQPRIDNTRMITLSAGEGGGTDVETKVDGLDLPIETGQEPLDSVILQEGNGYQSHSGKCKGHYVDGSSLKFQWINLPTVNEKGERIYYYVEEVRSAEFKYNTEYTYHYRYDETGNVVGVEFVTVTNTPNKISITAHKVWNWNDLGPKTEEDKKKLESQFSVTLSLIKDGKVVSNDTVLTNNNWDVTWGDLEAGHTYEVVEYSVETSPYNFTPKIEYSWGDTAIQLYNGGTVTVTNTYNPNPYKLPETGGTGTLPYTVGGALLTAMATLLLYIQNKRRKEGQGTS